MAQPNLLGDIELGFAYKNRASTNVTTNPLTTPANYNSISALDTRLKAINAGVYTDLYLSKMTVNDKIAAVRANDDAGTI